MYASVVISSGHGRHVRGASGILDEVHEARKVVDRVASMLEDRGVDVKVFHDNVSDDQNENLNRIVDFHNDQERELDISVHFNAYEQTSGPMGTEVLYITQSKLAAMLSSAIAEVGFIDRGPKYRDDLFFLNNTHEPAVLLEVCFVDSEADADIYHGQFEAICENIADLIGGEDEDGLPLPKPPTDHFLFRARGRCSEFGGPQDTGVSPSEDLAFFETAEDMRKAPQLFLPYQPEGTTGMARRLNPYVHYVACRWDYDVTPREMLLTKVARVRSTRDHDRSVNAFPADWGPNENTGRVADLSPGLMADLRLTTDDEVEVVFPWEEP